MPGVRVRTISGKTLCEEFRRVNGPRRPGDPCERDFDCLPYPADHEYESPEVVDTGFDEASPVVLHCDRGACTEGARIPSDLGEPCVPTAAGNVSESDACESGICFNENEMPFCGMACRDHADCPGVAYGCIIVMRSYPGYDFANAVCAPPSTPAGGAGGEGGGAGAGGDGGR
jgi:hypothetical protein